MRCDTLDQRLSATFDDPSTFQGELEAHVAGCLRCQAEMVRYRRLRNELAGLRTTPGVSVDGLFEDIVHSLDASVWARFAARHGRQAICTVAAAAGAAGAIVLLGRARGRHATG